MLGTHRKLTFLSPARSIHKVLLRSLTWHLTSKASNKCGLGLWDPRTLMSTAAFFQPPAFPSLPDGSVLALIWRGKARETLGFTQSHQEGSVPGACGRKGDLGFRAQTEPSMKIGRSSWRLASREVLCLQLWDPKYSFVFSPLLTQSTTWQGSYPLRSPFFFPSSWEWLSCLLRRPSWCGFCVWREVSFSGLRLLLPENISCAYCQFVSLAQTIVSQDLGLLAGSVTCRDIGMFGAEHCEVEGKIGVLVSPWQSPRPVWSLWRTVAESNANTFIPGGDVGISNACCLFPECTGGTVCPLALSLALCGELGLWAMLWMMERAGKGSSWPLNPGQKRVEGSRECIARWS